MEKKNRNRFGIKFNDYDSMHLFAIEKLNSLPTRRIASYLAEVIYAYENGDVQPQKQVVKTQLHTEKRGRGRPRKSPDTTFVQENVSKSDLESSSHIQNQSNLQNPTVPISVEVENSSSNEETASFETVSNDMIKSMMGFVGRS